MVAGMSVRHPPATSAAASAGPSSPELEPEAGGRGGHPQLRRGCEARRDEPLMTGDACGDDVGQHRREASPIASSIRDGEVSSARRLSSAPSSTKKSGTKKPLATPGELDREPIRLMQANQHHPGEEPGHQRARASLLGDRGEAEQEHQRDAHLPRPAALE